MKIDLMRINLCRNLCIFFIFYFVFLLFVHQKTTLQPATINVTKNVTLLAQENILKDHQE